MRRVRQAGQHLARQVEAARRHHVERARRHQPQLPGGPAGRADRRLGLGADSFVVELASNDGYLLQYFVERGVPVLGVEPAANVGGDTFDFSVERDTLHLSMTDAMGHEIDAAVQRVRGRGVAKARRRGSGWPSSSVS